MKSKVVFLVLLWVLFSAFGIALHQKARTVDRHEQDFVSVAGLDGEVYLERYCHIECMFRMRKRHPAEMIVAAPAYIVGSSVAQRGGEEPAKIALIMLFAAVSAAGVGLLWLVTEDLGAVALWLSFAYVWLLASAPELFAVSQLILIGTLLMVKRRVRDYRAWTGAALLAGGVTVTNFVKPLAAWAVCLKGDVQARLALRRQTKRLALIGGGIAAALVLAELAKWVWIDRLSPKDEILMGWEYITKWFSGGFGFGERLSRIWEMFFCEPVLTHGAIFEQANKQGLDILPLGYGSWVPHAVMAALFGLCQWGAWRRRADAVVQAALLMCAFDFALHVILGWGLVEAQIYCGHWLYLLPVLVAGVPGLWWKCALALVILIWNVIRLGGALP